MEYPRPQLNPVELRQLRWLLGGLIGLLSAWTVFYMEVDALLTLVFLTATVPVFTLFPRLSLALPGAFHLLAFPVIVALFAFDMWSSRDPLSAMVRLDLMLLCYRCVAPRRRREDLQLILLALFLVVVTGVYTVSIAFVAQILLFTAAALGMLLAVTLSNARSDGPPAKKDSAEVRTPAEDAGWERVYWRELGRRVRQVADLRVVALAGALFAGVVVLSALLFMALPRFEISNDFFLDRLITKSTRTGFSDTVNFQEVVDIQQDTSVAVMIDVSDPSAVPSEPYWRMVVLDEYSSEGFRMSSALKGTFSTSREKSPTHEGSSSVQDGTVWTVYFQPGVSKYLPLMGAFGRMTFGEPQALQQSRPLRLCNLPSDPAKMVAYRVHGMDTDGILRDRRFAVGHVLRPDQAQRRSEFFADEGAEGEERSDSTAVTFLELGLPRDADRELLEKWAGEIGGAGAGGGDFARRAGAWLQTRHSYSLSMRLAPGDGDPLIRWMDSAEPGHCELFAGSLVMLARAAGVPARLVTGFKGGSWNATSGSITVRNSDAHAWAEVWDEELGSWLRADATPGSEITPSPNAAARGGASSLVQDSGWGARIDGLRIFWYRRIVNFDRGLQRELLKETKARLSNLIQSGRKTADDYLRALVAWLRSPWDFSRFAGILFTVGVAAGGIVFWRRAGRSWWMGWRSRRAASHRRDPVRIEASRWLARLERAERQSTAASDAARESAGAARARLLRLRFGARSGWATPAAVFREARRAARALSRPGR